MRCHEYKQLSTLPAASPPATPTASASSSNAMALICAPDSPTAKATEFYEEPIFTTIYT